MTKTISLRLRPNAIGARTRTFSVRSFTVEIRDQIDLSGMQIIGWDSLLVKQIRSWVFDSDGGFGTGNLDQERESLVRPTKRSSSRRAEIFGG
ncbi:MAG: hypothetical protein V9E86_09740 [Nitrosomonas sp.]